MTDHSSASLPWSKFAAEFLGTALLLLLGLSIVIVIFGTGSRIAQLLPDLTTRRILSGFLFGSVGALIALSRLGKVSGAHINPSVTFGFWLIGKLEAPVAVGYVVAQLAGAIVGCLPLVAWGAMGRSLNFGATLPGPGFSFTDAVLGEAITTFGLMMGLSIFIGFRPLRCYTPLMIPLLFAFMVPLEAAISGTSTNPARSLGPAIISGEWDGWWIYWVGPAIGTLVAMTIVGFLGVRIEEARLYHFESTPQRVFRRHSL